MQICLQTKFCFNIVKVFHRYLMKKKARYRILLPGLLIFIWVAIILFSSCSGMLFLEDHLFQNFAILQLKFFLILFILYLIQTKIIPLRWKFLEWPDLLRCERHFSQPKTVLPQNIYKMPVKSLNPRNSQVYRFKSILI